MTRLFEVAGSIGLSSAAQILAGSLIGALLYRLLKPCCERKTNFFSHSFVLILLSSLAGIILPLDSFGILPIVICLLAGGFRAYEALPIYLSNSLFSMIIPFTEVGYQWSSGFWRLGLALLIGVVGGLILKKLGPLSEGITFGKLMRRLAPKGCDIKSLGRFVLVNTVFFLIVAVIGGVLYDQYYYDLLSAFKTWFYSTPVGFEFAKTLSTLNLFNYVFLAALSIVDTLINPVKILALFIVLKIRGVFGYYLYLGLWSVILSVSLLIK